MTRETLIELFGLNCSFFPWCRIWVNDKRYYIYILKLKFDTKGNPLRIIRHHIVFFSSQDTPRLIWH